MKRVNYPRIIGLSNDWQISWIHMLRGHEMLGRFPSSTGSGISHSVWKNPKSLIFNFTLKITKITPWRKRVDFLARNEKYKMILLSAWFSPTVLVILQPGKSNGQALTKREREPKKWNEIVHKS